jgi:hypothetical protein
MRSKSTFSLQFASLDSWRNWGGAREERVVRVMREGERDRERERPPWNRGVLVEREGKTVGMTF